MSCGNEPEYIQNALKHVQHADQIPCSWTTCDVENAIDPSGPPCAAALFLVFFKTKLVFWLILES